MYGGSFLGRKKLGRFLAPFDTKKGVFQIQPITNTGHGKQNQNKQKYSLQFFDKNYFVFLPRNLTGEIFFFFYEMEEKFCLQTVKYIQHTLLLLWRRWCRRLLFCCSPFWTGSKIHYGLDKMTTWQHSPKFILHKIKLSIL